MNLDWESEPAWKDYTALVDFDNEALKPWKGTPIPDFFPGDPTTQKAAVRGQLRDHDCPFAWLLGDTISFIF